ncbi:MAG: zinc-ribbon domain-containing protein [Methanoregula sp.]
MSYPELYSDERIVLQAQNVKVKSVVFEVVLTTRRLVLIDTKKSSIPPQEINLATLKDVESGENAIRDPTITISIITISGNTRQMVLTFSKTSGGERRRECDDWVRELRQNITSTIYHPVTQEPPPGDAEPALAAQPPPRPPHQIEITSTPPPKKRIEVARPMKKIVEPAPAMPVPIETTSLPSGSFCNRCGNRVPPESAFCNRCGTPVVYETDSVNLPMEERTVPLQQPSPVVPQVQVPPSTVISAVGENTDSRIEEVIHTIEPLIEDSVPRTAPAPLVPSKQPQYASPADIAESASQVPPAANVETPDGVIHKGDVKWPVLSHAGTSDTSAPAVAPVNPAAPGSLPTTPPRKTSYKLIAVLAVVVLAVIAGTYVFMQGQAGTPEITPTPEITVPATTVPQATVAVVATTMNPTPTPQQGTTPSLLIPTSGVWVNVMYPSKFSGTIGTPEYSRDVADSGDQFYQISTSKGPVVVSIQKSDGSSAELAVDVYQDGNLIKHAATTTPKGSIEFQASLNTDIQTTTTTP